MKHWDAVDERCPYCNSITKKVKGINKQNLKKLCWTKPTIQDILIFMMLCLSLLMAWTYYNEIAQYKEIYENPGEFCNSYMSNKPIQGAPFVEINVSKYEENGYT